MAVNFVTNHVICGNNLASDFQEIVKIKRVLSSERAAALLKANDGVMKGVFKEMTSRPERFGQRQRVRRHVPSRYYIFTMCGRAC